VRATARVNCLEGVGVAEAPRGTLMHHYTVNDDGLITRANLIIATGHNNASMNRGVLQTARQFVRGDQVTEGILNRVEAVIRTYDPCLSCSTHAVGQMPLAIDLRAPDGSLVRSLRRD
jgi:NAD-reducing hydrogenase large subunit